MINLCFSIKIAFLSGQRRIPPAIRPDSTHFYFYYSVKEVLLAIFLAQVLQKEKQRHLWKEPLQQKND
jgi:hypothetical protein